MIETCRLKNVIIFIQKFLGFVLSRKMSRLSQLFKQGVEQILPDGIHCIIDGENYEIDLM